MDYVFYGLIALIVLVIVVPRLLVLKYRISGEVARTKVKEGAVLVDVRTRAEFGAGHIEGSRNIPLDLLPKHLAELKEGGPVVVCCASGMRSARAARMLAGAGCTVHDLGSWRAW